MGRRKADLPYASYKTQKEYCEEATELLTELLGYELVVTPDNCAKWVYAISHIRNTLVKAGWPVPDLLRRAHGKLYGASMGRLKSI